MAMQPYTIEQIQGAVVKAMRVWKSSKIIPIGVIVEQIENSAGKIEDRAVVMATKILDHLHRFGASKSPDLSDDPIASGLMETRWPYQRWASTIIESEEKWWVKEFCEAYRSHCNIESTKPAIDAPKRFKELACGIGNM
jgi:hypothetical protein